MSDSQAVQVSKAEWALASTQRSHIYGGFSALFAKEVSDESFQAYFANGRFIPFAGLEELGLEGELQRLNAAIEALRQEPLARLELAADFAQLFLLDAQTGALPYASAYAGESSSAPLYSDAEAKMCQILSAHGLSVESGFREPADHLAVLLSLLAHVAQGRADVGDVRSAALEQSTLLGVGILDWLPRFVDRCQKASPSFDVYPALASLLLAFARADQLFLNDIADTA